MVGSEEDEGEEEVVALRMGWRGGRPRLSDFKLVHFSTKDSPILVKEPNPVN